MTNYIFERIKWLLYSLRLFNWISVLLITPTYIQVIRLKLCAKKMWRSYSTDIAKLVVKVKDAFAERRDAIKRRRAWGGNISFNWQRPKTMRAIFQRRPSFGIWIALKLNANFFGILDTLRAVRPKFTYHYVSRWPNHQIDPTRRRKKRHWWQTTNVNFVTQKEVANYCQIGMGATLGNSAMDQQWKRYLQEQIKICFPAGIDRGDERFLRRL